MQTDSQNPTGEMLRAAMRRWATGVSIVTSLVDQTAHGMTVNSFGSISLDPPLVTVTMNHNTRTQFLVEQSGIFAVTVLSRLQQPLAELFAGRVDEHGDRMAGLDTFSMITGAPLLRGGLAFVDCRVAHRYDMAHATLYVGEVVAAETGPLELPPLIYYRRTFTELCPE